jgi:hypothetical protein
MKQLGYIPLLCWFAGFFCTNPTVTFGQDSTEVKKSQDFIVSGDGSADNWKNTEWVYIRQWGNDDRFRSTKVKILYSETGIYFLFFCEDTRLTATIHADHMRLWEEDVVEVFLAPDAGNWDHFEYELSPLNHELTLFVAKNGNTLTCWLPFYYKENELEKTCHATGIIGGEKRSHANIMGWTAEFYIPFRLLGLFNNVPPRSGTTWRGNIYRVDYDLQPSIDWTWQPVSGSYHNTDEYGILVFE